MAEIKTGYPELPPLEKVDVLGEVIEVPAGSIINLNASKIKKGHRCTTVTDFEGRELLNGKIPEGQDPHMRSIDNHPIHETTSHSFRYSFTVDTGGPANPKKETVVRTATKGARFTIVSLAEPKPAELKQTKMF